MRNILFLVIFLAFISNCKDKKTGWVKTLPAGDRPVLVAKLAQMTNPCNDTESYIPDQDHLKHTSLKIVKVNVHIIQNGEGKGNLAGEWGRKYIHEILLSAKGTMYKNEKMRLPLRNQTPVIPTRIGYELWPTTYIPGDDGIYYHQDEELYYNINRGKNKNIFKRDVFEKYGIQKDSVLNIFVKDVHLDSLESKTFDPKSNGVAFSTWVKAANWYDSIRDTVYSNGKALLPKKYVPAKLLNHEIGHVFGLAHAWRKDYCEDTPEHKNCWNATGRPPCINVSNNIMDYNAHMSALTPCQLGRMHHSMMTKEVKRNLLKKDWCQLNIHKSIKIQEEITWNDCKTIQGNIIIENGGKLIMRCKTSMPNNSEIVVYPGGELILQGAHLYNDCNSNWKGIRILGDGKKAGTVIHLGDATKIEHCAHPIELQEVEAVKS